MCIIFAGHYLYIETTRENVPATATITSLPYFKYESSGCELRFFYHAYGADIGQLSVTIDHDAGTQASEVIVDGPGDSQDSWKLATLSVPSEQGYYTVHNEWLLRMTCMISLAKVIKLCNVTVKLLEVHNDYHCTYNVFSFYSHKIVLVNSTICFSWSSESAGNHQKIPSDLPAIVLNDIL